MNKKRWMKLAGILKEDHRDFLSDNEPEEYDISDLDFEEELSTRDVDYESDPEYSEDKLGDYYGQSEEEAEEENIKDYMKYGKKPISGDHGPFAATPKESVHEQNVLDIQEETVSKWFPYFSQVGFSKDAFEMVKPEVIKLLGSTLKSYVKDQKSQGSTKGQVDYVAGHKKGVEDYGKGEYMAYKTKSPTDTTLVDNNGKPISNKLINFAKGYIKGYKSSEEKDEAKL